jgi:outer membrane receptor protein involved in Fe transport
MINRLTISTSLFHSIGTDYHAYISTGDSIILNNKLRPVIKKGNIGEVKIYGGELSVQYNILKDLTYRVGYSHIVTTITEYERLDEFNEIDLEGKELVYQPKNIFNTSLTWNNKIINSAIVFNYKGKQWTNDENTEKIDGYYFIDLHLWRPVYKGLSASLMVFNLLDDNYVDSKNLLSPGRMITCQLSYTF